MSDMKGDLGDAREELRSQSAELASVREELRCLRGACDEVKKSSALQEKRQRYNTTRC